VFSLPFSLFLLFWLRNLLATSVAMPPVEVAPAAIKAQFVRQAGHIV
jgi:hypothetical protein